MLIRSALFNVVFFLHALVCSLGLSWSFLLPRKWAQWVIRNFYFKTLIPFERLILNLDYRVEGRENLPQAGSYILAVKHQSTYETLKVPVLFGDIAIILKRELTWIPFWGWYTLKMGMIPVDRGGRDKAIASIINGSRKVLEDGRPILIFPQGTRVAIDETIETKPYKAGILRLADTLNLPIVPVAINAGYFWPKHRFMKKPGIVDFKILPPIPAGTKTAELMRILPQMLEAESHALVEKARAAPVPRKTPWLPIVFALFAAWSAWWFSAAHYLKGQLAHIVSEARQPEITGYPFAMRITWSQLAWQDAYNRYGVPILQARVLPGARIWLSAPKGMIVDYMDGDVSASLTVAGADASIRPPAFWKAPAMRNFTLEKARALFYGSVIAWNGDVAIPTDENRPIEGAGKIVLTRYAPLLAALEENGFVDSNLAKRMKAMLDMVALSQGQAESIAVPIAIRDSTAYAGPFALFSLRAPLAPDGQSVPPPQKNRSGGSATDGIPALVPKTAR